MSSADWPHGVDRRVYPQLDSTNAEALRIGAELSGPTWLLALEQTAARGRRGRAWANPAGNFAASLVMRPEGPLTDWALRSFVAALALQQALSGLGVAEADLGLKWPNDVLLRGGKLAGILLECAGPLLVIGIGVNLVTAPDPQALEPDAVPPVSLEAATGLRATPEALLDHIAPAYARLEAQFLAQGFEPIRRAWLASAVRLNQPIRARTGALERRGLFRTVDGNGNLVLETPDGVLAIPAADVFL